jgi:hypothetical protein
MYFSENEFTNPLYPLLIPPLVRGDTEGSKRGLGGLLNFHKILCEQKDHEGLSYFHITVCININENE